MLERTALTNPLLFFCVCSFTGPGPVADVELPLIDESFEFPFDLNMWPQNQTIAGVKINNNNRF